MREDLKEDWATGVFTAESNEASVMKSVQSMAHAQALEAVCVAIEEMEEEND